MNLRVFFVYQQIMTTNKKYVKSIFISASMYQFFYV